MNDISQRIDAVKRKVYGFEGRVDNARLSLSELEDFHTTLEVELINFEKALAILTMITDQRREQLKKKVENLVTFGLRQVFEIDYEFFFSLDESRGLRSMTPRVLVHGVETDIVGAHGGGLVVVVGFLLRLAVLLMYGGGRKSKVLILDETFSHVSESYLGNLSEMLRLVSHKLGVQIILVSHQEQLAEAADVVYEVGKTKGMATVNVRSR